MIKIKTLPAGMIVFLVASAWGSIAHAQIGYDKKFEFGAAIGFFLLQDTTSYVGFAPQTIKRLGGNISGSHCADWTVVPILTQTYGPFPHLSLELKERFWMTVVKGSNPVMPELNYRLEKDVWPITLSFKVTFFSTAHIFGGSLYLGPGVYITDVKQRGYFGNNGGTYLSPGIHAGGEFSISPTDYVDIRLDVTYDSFHLKEMNFLLQDGGEGGGLTISIGVEYLLDF